MIADAAIRYPDGTIYRASRHGHCIEQAAKTGKHSRLDKFEQGFMIFQVFSGGYRERFADREEAKGEAIRDGLVKPDHGTLYSEDVWPIICPRCYGHQGFYQKWVEVRTYFFDFRGNGDGEADDPRVISGGRRYYCQECNADITTRLKKEGL